MTETQQPDKKDPFTELFKRHPWLVPLLMMLRRQLGITREFLDLYVAPHAKKK